MTVSNVTETLQELLKGFEPVVVDVKDLNEHKAWGNKFIDNFAKDIRIAFPDSKGYSARNLKYMAKFAEIYSDREFVQQVVAQILWG